MQQRNNAADYKEYGTNYTKKEQSIIESYTPIIKIAKFVCATLEFIMFVSIKSSKAAYL